MATNEEAITDQEIFESAVSDQEQTQNTPVEPTEAPTEAKGDGSRERDEKGRFKPAEAPEEVVSNETTEPEVEDRADRIPSWRLKEEAEAKREALARADRAEREASEFRRQMAELQRKMAETNAPKPEPIDMFADPEGWQRQYQQTVDQRFRSQEINFSCRLARSADPETFDKAWDAAAQKANQGDNTVMKAVAESSDPGQTLLSWYKREQVISKVGTDPDAYVQKRIEEALNDPAFLAKAVERARASTGAQPNNRIDLPPSLSRASGSSRNAGGDDDLSDAGIFANALRR